MFDHITEAQVTAINDVLTAGKIFQETINKHVPGGHNIHWAIEGAIARIIVGENRQIPATKVEVVNTSENPVVVTSSTPPQ